MDTKEKNWGKKCWVFFSSHLEKMLGHFHFGMKHVGEEGGPSLGRKEKANSRPCQRHKKRGGPAGEVDVHPLAAFPRRRGRKKAQDVMPRGQESFLFFHYSSAEVCG